jgi:hypothetical protein
VWIDNVKICLMKSLVLSIELNCTELKKYASSTHVQCYLNPDQNSQSKSICSFFLQKDYDTLIDLLKSYELQDFMTIDALKTVNELMAKCAMENFGIHITAIKKMMSVLGEMFKETGNSLLFDPLNNLIKEVQKLFDLMG